MPTPNNDSEETLWQGAPNQAFKLWNSKDSQETLQTTVLIAIVSITLFLAIFAIVSVYAWLVPTAAESKVDTVWQLWLFLLVPALLFLLVMDVRDYIFRKGNKYLITKEGITFRVGSFKKQTHFVEWNSVKEIQVDEDEYFLHLIPQEKFDFHTNTPNTEEYKTPYIDTKSKIELEKLSALIKSLIRNAKKKRKRKNK